MCTAIYKKGKDIIYGYNLDIDPTVWNYSLKKSKDVFSVCITVGKTTYFTHGVNSTGHFANIPYENGDRKGFKRGKKRERIDLLVDKYIKGKYTFDDIERIINEKDIVNVNGLSFHSLLGNKEGNVYIIEPEYGIKKIKESYAVITNFPILTELEDYSNVFYGKDRYDEALSVLEKSSDDFGVMDALNLLNEVKQNGRYGTRISFVYSSNENKVYYALNGNFDNILVHEF